MKDVLMKLLYGILLVLLFAACVQDALAQTFVTGTATDPNGNPYASGTASATSVPTSGLPQTSTTPVTTNASGAFSMPLAPNTYIFTICAPPVQIGPLGNVTPPQICFSSGPIAVSGSSQDITAALSGLSPVIGPSVTGTLPNPANFPGVVNFAAGSNSNGAGTYFPPAQPFVGLNCDPFGAYLVPGLSQISCVIGPDGAARLMFNGDGTQNQQVFTVDPGGNPSNGQVYSFSSATGEWELTSSAVLPAGVAVGSVLTSSGVGNPAVYQSKPVLDARDYGVIANGTVDDTTAMQSALNAACSGKELDLWTTATPKITSTLTLTNCSNMTFDGKGASFAAWAGGNAAIFRLISTSRSVFQNFKLTCSVATPCSSFFTSERGASGNPTHVYFFNITGNGTNGGVTDAFSWILGAGGDAGNDTFQFNHVEFDNYSNSCFNNSALTQAQQQAFYNITCSGNGFGPYGYYGIGSIAFYNFNGGGHTNADFAITAPNNGVLISGGLSIGSARLYSDQAGNSTTMPVTISGFNFANNALNASGYVMQLGFRGPYYILNNQVSGSTAVPSQFLNFGIGTQNLVAIGNNIWTNLANPFTGGGWTLIGNSVNTGPPVLVPDSFAIGATIPALSSTTVSSTSVTSQSVLGATITGGAETLGGELADAFAGSSLSSNWTTVLGAFAVSSGAVSQSSAQSLAYWNAYTSNSNQFSQTQVGTPGANGIGPAVRMSAGGAAYLAYANSSPAIFLYYRTAVGGFTQLGTTYSGAVNANDIIKISAVGTTITVTLNGTPICSTPVTDSHLATGSPGLYGQGAASGTLKLWTGGSIAPLNINGQFTSTLATGTAPLSITSTTPVANLTVTQAKFLGPSPWIDVTHPTYGADPTGVADSTAAINAAIAACPVNGGTVYFPPGTYLVSTASGGNIIVASTAKCTLLGLNHESIIKRGATGTLIQVLASNVRISGLTLIGNTTYGPDANTGVCIVGLNTTQLQIENNVISGCGGPAGTNAGNAIQFNSVTHFKILNNRITQPATGFSMLIFGNSQYGVIGDNDLDGTLDTGTNPDVIAIHSQTAGQTSSDIVIERNTIIGPSPSGGGGFGVEVGDFGGLAPTNIVVQGNSCKGVASTAGCYSMVHTINVVLSGNACNSNGFAFTIGCYEITGSNGPTVTGNSCNSGFSGGVGAHNCVSWNTSNNGTATGNVFTNWGNAGASNDRAMMLGTSFASAPLLASASCTEVNANVNLVTCTSISALSSQMLPGTYWCVHGVSVSGYNICASIVSTPTTTSFTYLNSTTGLGTGNGGTLDPSVSNNVISANIFNFTAPPLTATVLGIWQQCNNAAAECSHNRINNNIFLNGPVNASGISISQPGTMDSNDYSENTFVNMAVAFTRSSSSMTNANFCNEVFTSVTTPFSGSSGTVNNAPCNHTATLAGGTTAYTLAVPIPGLDTNTPACFVVNASNTAASTLAVNGLTAKAITKNGATALAASDLLIGAYECAVYDGTEWVLQGKH